MPGTLYLIPTILADETAAQVLPAQVAARVAALSCFLVENARTARRFIKSVAPQHVIETLAISVIDKDSTEAEISAALKPVLAGQDAGVISEAGCPGVADPGAEIARLAHRLGIKVVPLVGPSSLLLALMASGMNGQSFAFHGYLPIERAQRAGALRALEKQALTQHQTQLFIETPYRNMQLLEDLLAHLHPGTRLCIAANLTAPDEFIRTDTVAGWKGKLPQIHKQPAVFLIGR
ncbi:16S rRNA (cytidine1402-2'-O)-methyltransferase [Hymenobacter daecheongensis DSM 21074]|uniref:16S rRNA (Cytidine1402-2'-O)-methyltransferase n=1 Tax=Hymenobacter daecheongensis DSM 21074 TaxID=1121955 RepID=A0A1M6A5N5_9BACT|nr:SAM-dependent methyltransferase [Hymenobacter daecheongensis]SHI31794.1 16S rRNA (cytidine1402-2'-O)-methyltransferase [Hymenobacter daecheongensis DSM 21074]